MPQPEQGGNNLSQESDVAGWNGVPSLGHEEERDVCTVKNRFGVLQVTDEDPIAAVGSIQEEAHDCSGTACACLSPESGTWKIVARRGRKSRICVPEQLLGESQIESRTGGTTVVRTQTGSVASGSDQAACKCCDGCALLCRAYFERLDGRR